jgi:predicted ABC-type ATPase
MERYQVKRRNRQPYDRFVWSDDEAHDIFCRAIKFNPYHHPAGDEHGGEFTTADDGGGGGGSDGPPSLIHVTDRLGNAINIDSTSSLHRWLIRRPDGTWGVDPTRELLHQQIVNRMLETAHRQDGPLTMYMTGGGPAAGKSSALGPSLPDDAVRIDPDYIKTQLPEWDVLTAAHDKNAGTYLHEESSLIRKRLEAAAIAGNYNVVLDTTGDSSVDKLASNLQKYRDAGYSVKAYYATVNPDVAMERNLERFQKTGRLVPETVLRTAYADVSHTFPNAVERGLYDEYHLYSTDTKIPKEVASGTKDSPMVIHDRQAWNQFLSYDKTKKSVDDSRVGTDVLAKMVVAINHGVSRNDLHLNAAASELWDKIAAEIADAPDGCYIDPGNELTQEDLTNLYSGPLAMDRAVKFATTAGALDKTVQWVPIKKTDGEKQIVYGEVYAPYILDTYGEFMTPEDIELMAHRFMQLDLSKVIDTQHNNQPNGSFPVESFIAREGDPDYTPGSWVLGVHIPDSELWTAVKSGLLNGFSFQSLVKPTTVDVEIDAFRDFVGETELSEDHRHTFFVELDDIGNVVGGRTSKASDGHYHEIKWASVTDRVSGHSHRFFL